jgi:oxygen-independent coproporphyrinogen-3 oxidase
MCTLKTSWKGQELYFKEIPEVVLNLKEMESDALIVISSDGIEVTEKGRPFIRNICMGFDLLLKRKKPETQLFSMTI